jgi:uncharacterized protein (TIRG00374 family)
LGWYFAFGKNSTAGLSFFSLFLVRWTGEALNNVVPSAYIGGEALKAYLLNKKGTPLATAASAIVVGRTVQTLAQLVFIALGAIAFRQILSVAPGLWKGIFAVLIVGLMVVIVLFWLQIRGLFGGLWRLFKKLHIRLAILETENEHLHHIDRQIVEFYRTDRKYFALSFGAYFIGWLFDTVEIYLTAYLLGIPMAWIQALAIESFVSVAKFLGLFVPGAIGVQEAGIVFLCRAAGLPDAFGITYAIIRRGREVVYAAIGWLIIYSKETPLQGWVHKFVSEKRSA